MTIHNCVLCFSHTDCSYSHQIRFYYTLVKNKVYSSNVRLSTHVYTCIIFGQDKIRTDLPVLSAQSERPLSKAISDEISIILLHFQREQPIITRLHFHSFYLHARVVIRSRRLGYARACSLSLSLSLSVSLSLHFVFTIFYKQYSLARFLGGRS